jgi:hypothetical protein
MGAFSNSRPMSMRGNASGRENCDGSIIFRQMEFARVGFFIFKKKGA